jgi:hypothetical protein
MAIKDRLDKLSSRVKRCPVCNYPGPVPPDAQVAIVVSLAEVGPETGRARGYKKLEPRYCSGCGRELSVIRVKGIQDKPYVRREDGV